MNIVKLFIIILKLNFFTTFKDNELNINTLK